MDQLNNGQPNNGEEMEINNTDLPVFETSLGVAEAIVVSNTRSSRPYFSLAAASVAYQNRIDKLILDGKWLYNMNHQTRTYTTL